MGRDDQFNAIEARCTRFAAELLRELRKSPYFPELLDFLGQKPGRIFRSDIESAFVRLRGKQRDNNE